MPDEKDASGFDETGHYRKAEAYLHQGQLQEAKAELDYIEVSRKIAKHKSVRRQTVTSIVLVLLCLILVSLGMYVRLGSTDIQLDIKANNIQLTGLAPDTPLLQGSIAKGDGLTINDAEYFNDIPQKFYRRFKLNTAAPHSGDIVIDAKSVELTELSILPAGQPFQLVIHKRQADTHLYIKNAGIRGAVATNKLHSLYIENRERKYSIPRKERNKADASYYFAISESGRDVIPGGIELHNARFLNLKSLGVQSLDFLQEYPPHSGNFQSTIVAGKLHLEEIGRTLLLNQGEYLALDCRSCEQHVIKLDGNELVVQLRGSITSLIGGHKRDFRNYMPTLLEYLYHNKKITMLWAAFLFVIGLMWNLRGVINI